jgi:hypothetical protein
VGERIVSGGLDGTVRLWHFYHPASKVVHYCDDSNVHLGFVDKG